MPGPYDVLVWALGVTPVSCQWGVVAGVLVGVLLVWVDRGTKRR